MTMGIVPEARLAATAAGVLDAKITSTFNRTSSAASSGSRSYLPLGGADLEDDALTLDPAEISEAVPEGLVERRARG